MVGRRRAARRGPGVVGTVARTALIAGTATTVAKGVSGSMDARAHAAQQEQQAKAQQQADMQEMQQQLASLQAQQVQDAAAAPAPEKDVVAELQKLGELKSAGLLNDAEFEAAKARVLGT